MKNTSSVSIMKITLLQFILVIACTGIAFSQNKEVRHPVYPAGTADIEALKKSVEPLMRMSIKQVIAQVPTESGIFFVGCPSCHGGEQEENVLGWEFGMGEKVRCNYCKMVFPNEKFPNNRETVIIAPSGVRQVYRYYQSPEGPEYHFEPHAWYERWLWINPMAERLARLWFVTKDNAYGDRAAAIAGRFAQVFPDYAIRYDYPNKPVKFFPANQKWPYEGLAPYRGAKWRWWGHDDIPTDLTNVYDILQSGYDWKRMDAVIGPETDKRVAKDMLRLGYEFVAANPEYYGNKTPGHLSMMIRVGRVLEDPLIVHEAVKRFREFLARRYFADGWWLEGTPGYHGMTIRGLKSVADAFKGYTAPPDWKGERFDNLDLTAGAPLYQKALRIGTEARMPDGRSIPINDTGWGLPAGGQKPDRTISRLWPSLGNAALGTGEGENQIMLNLNWSGNYGHSHYDNASIILFAAGKELLSDIGYTHGKYRPWTVSTPSHNTVVINQTGQDVGLAEKPVTGQLKFYDDSDIHVKAIDLDASPAYAIAKTYRRRLVMVHAGPGRDYVVDRFDVEGGKDHDWFLHGMCEQEGKLETSIALDRPVETLVPDGAPKDVPHAKTDPVGKRFHPYAYLYDVKTGAPAPLEKPWTATWRYDGGAGLRTYNFPSAGMQVFRFRSPSVRPANDDDNKLEDFFSGGIMQRNSGKASTFLAVHEPFNNAPWIESVQNDRGTLVVRYKLNGTAVEDRVTLDDAGIAVTSSAGWKYNSGTVLSGVVEALESANGKFRLRLDRQAPKVKYVRLDLSDGGTRYYPVAAVNANWLELVDDPGFILEKNGQVQFQTFPQDQHPGPLRYTLFAPSLSGR